MKVYFTFIVLLDACLLCVVLVICVYVGVLIISVSM